jgi:hypothetical protein
MVSDTVAEWFARAVLVVGVGFILFMVARDRLAVERDRKLRIRQVELMERMASRSIPPVADAGAPAQGRDPAVSTPADDQ